MKPENNNNCSNKKAWTGLSPWSLLYWCTTLLTELSSQLRAGRVESLLYEILHLWPVLLVTSSHCDNQSCFQVTIIAVKAGARVEFVKTRRVTYQFTFQLGGEKIRKLCRSKQCSRRLTLTNRWFYRLTEVSFCLLFQEPDVTVVAIGAVLWEEDRVFSFSARPIMNRCADGTAINKKMLFFKTSGTWGTKLVENVKWSSPFKVSIKIALKLGKEIRAF